jgi:hypothetical protein
MVVYAVGVSPMSKKSVDYVGTFWEARLKLLERYDACYKALPRMV